MATKTTKRKSTMAVGGLMEDDGRRGIGSGIEEGGGAMIMTMCCAL